MQNVKEKMRNLKVAAVHFWNVRCVETPGISCLNGQRTLPVRVPASADGPLRNWPEWSGRTEYCLSQTREIKAEMGCQAITNNQANAKHLRRVYSVQRNGGQF